MNKKSYLRTIEVMIAILITFLFLYYVFPSSQTPKLSDKINTLEVLENNDIFRSCAIALDYDCVGNLLEDYVPVNYDFVFDIAENPDVFRVNLPKKDINTEMIYLSGNITMYSPKLVKIYYWRK